MLNALFLIGCSLTILAVLAVLDWSAAPCIGWPEFPKPRMWRNRYVWRAYIELIGLCLRKDAWGHLRGLSRLGVLAGAAAGAVDYQGATWTQTLLMWSIGTAYAVQAYTEALRQSRVPATGERRRAS